jgi:predicted nucleic acid-binding protein
MARSPLLVDSPIWIDHIDKGDPQLVDQLRSRRVVMHPMIIGEIALGSITRRAEILEQLHALKQIKAVAHAEVMAMIEWLKLPSTGIGYVDAHLLAAVRQTPNARLWTRDKRLAAQAERLEVAYTP